MVLLFGGILARLLNASNSAQGYDAEVVSYTG
jgi:hypothetical protein